ncbi:hypothetical protein FIH33_15405 [Salmonella enterica subsp. enterica]|nr:hypothetical protein [Salmonella enterica subsp. enterica serovar Okatie]EBG2966197.1 hypothetical protein [Salmonella enterica subsp. enterica serovar Okatie]EBI7260523.1 hypothetical protein [Salmonella enterica]ECV3919489.1 hypothetical protein [Salmonella enterica subsp. enterica serovar O rough]EDH6653000.1 hypothetical protein [Salmonella enterica subsp. enterica serovar Okatie]
MYYLYCNYKCHYKYCTTQCLWQATKVVRIRDIRKAITVRCVPGIVIHTLRVTLLSDSGYALIGYEYCARIM